jgi:hypothetical protein
MEPFITSHTGHNNISLLGFLLMSINYISTTGERRRIRRPDIYDI